MQETRPVPRKSFKEMTFRERLLHPRLWVFAVLGAIALGVYRYVLDRYWPNLEAELGWLAFQAVWFGGAFVIYLLIALLVGPFRDRAPPAGGAGRRA